MTFQQTATRIEGNIPHDLPVQNNDRFIFISKDQRAMTHGLHKYPAKFFPELPRWLIQRYSDEGDLVLDPFMGSGTTNLESSMLGRLSVGVDVDPFSRFISKVKVTPLPEKRLMDAYNYIRPIVQDYHESKVINGIPNFPYRDNWFKPEILKEMAFIKATILNMDTTQPTRNFFLVCFSSIIRAVSQADNNCTRTVVRKKLDKQVKPGYAIALFIKRIDTHVPKMLEFSKLQVHGKVKIPSNANACKITGYRDNQFDLALTSPPYLNAVDYPRTHQLEMYWLGFASGSLQSLKRTHIGTEAVYSREYSNLHLTGCDSADKIITEIYAIDKRRAFIATKYINDMIANLTEIYRVLKPGNPYVLVIGNNQVRGLRFETWRYLAEYAPQIGYTVECNFISEIINHHIKVPRKEQIIDDHILVLRK